MIDPLANLSNTGRRLALAALTAASVAIVPIAPSAGAAHMAESTDRLSYVLLFAGGQSSSMSGSMEDLRHAKSLRTGREGLLYVRYQGFAYVIRDPATLRQANAIFEPQIALGARQAELGSRQAALGSRQAQLGAKQAELGLQQAAAAPRRAVELGRQQDALGQQQTELGRQQDMLGRQQGALGAEQSRLGRLVDAKIRALVADAIQRGVAHRVD